MRISDLAREINESYFKKSLKRQEENHKFIFKLIQKQLKKQFAEEKKITPQHENFDT